MSNYHDYDQPTICPYCNYDDCRADYVDVGVGMIQCGPYYCDNCGACQIGPYDKEAILSEKENEFGWYEPKREYLTSAPTVNGKLVRNHEDAKNLYDLGFLDIKE